MVVSKETDIAFENAYGRWLQEQIRTAKAGRKQKLQQGLTFPEKLFARNVWWTAFGNFDHLHAQYEVRDFKDGVRYVDFVYIKNGIRLCIEIDPFGTHGHNLSRWNFDDNLDRQNDLVLDDWKVLRFSLDQIQEKPRKCQQKLQQGLGKWGAVRDPMLPSNPIDQAIVACMLRREEPLSPIEVSRELGWHRSTIARHMDKLSTNNRVLIAKSGNSRITKYTINPARHNVNKRGG